MNGYAVARTLRARPEFDHVHIAAVTGWGQDDDRRKARGQDSTVTSPNLSPLTRWRRCFAQSPSARPPANPPAARRALAALIPHPHDQPSLSAALAIGHSAQSAPSPRSSAWPASGRWSAQRVHGSDSLARSLVLHVSRGRRARGGDGRLRVLVSTDGQAWTSRREPHLWTSHRCRGSFMCDGQRRGKRRDDTRGGAG